MTTTAPIESTEPETTATPVGLTEADFQNAIDNYQMKALYDTGVTAEYGDELITLVTCSYHTDNGRFVVIGRAVEEVEQ